MNLSNNKMNIEIWSDVVCPFCYIGKRRFEAALSQFQFKNNIEVVWRSFQLNPALVTNPNVSVIENLADTKGWTIEYATDMTQYVTQMAGGVGLNFNFQKAVLANSFNAHRLLQFAKTKALGNEIKEQLFKAYFIEGKNIDDSQTLINLGTLVGLPINELSEVITNNKLFANEVENDKRESAHIGIRGVPFFYLNKQQVISGAQETPAFLNAIERVYIDWKDKA